MSDHTNNIEEGDTVSYNGGMNTTVIEVDGDQILINVAGEERWVHVTEVKLIKKVKIGYGDPGENLT